MSRPSQRRLLLIGSSLALTGGIERLTLAYLRAFKQLNFSVATAELDPRRGFWGRIEFLGRLAGRILGPRPTIVFTSHVAFARLIPLLRLIRPGLPACVLLHGREVWDGPRRRSELRGVRACRVVVAVSCYTQRQFERSWPRAPACVVIYPAVWPQPQFFIGSTSPVASPSTALRLLCVSRLQRTDRRKGVAELICAVGRLRMEGYNVTLRVVGDGDDRARLSALATVSGADESVRFLGRLDDYRLWTEYQAADVFALPSEQEGFGLVYLEAMSHGLPIVALRQGPIPEVVAPGGSLLLPSRRVDHIMAALVTLANDVPLRTRMGIAAREHVETSFPPDRFLESVRELLADMDLAPFTRLDADEALM